MSKFSPSTDLYIGLMSGTSMDSMDAVLIDLSNLTPKLLHTATKNIGGALKQKLLKLCLSFDESGSTSEPRLLKQLDQQLAVEFSQLVVQLLNEVNINAKNICAIGSHGQTVFHLPPTEEKNGFSLQIGNPQSIANKTNILTIGDFRNADMQQGGQGAPLVPAFHKAVFSSPTKKRVVVNIGGMANITVLPNNGKVIGFDTGPGNVLLDSWCYQHTGNFYDERGSWGATGKPHEPLLTVLLNEPYFQKRPPKSTGRELFNAQWLEKKLAILEKKPSAADVQYTLALLTARTISQAIKKYALKTEEVFICGGGAHNQLLIQLLEQESTLAICSTETIGLHPNWVEATAFAWLAQQTSKGLPGNLPEVTGATTAVVLGKTFLPCVAVSAN